MNEGSCMKKQKGLTLISWLAILAVVLFNAIIALNVVPVYINDHSVKTMMKNLQMDSTVRGKTPKKLKEIITKRLRVNNVYSVTAEHITIKKERNDYLITIEYQPRGKLVGSLDYIVDFKHEARVPAN
jgi:Tfp pilus assembly major pilin PilA